LGCVPAYALLTTAGLGGGYPSGVGISVGGGNNVFTVGGSVYSNSTINTPKGMDVGTNFVGAFGVCTGTITGTPVQCNTGTTVADPGGGFKHRAGGSQSMGVDGHDPARGGPDADVQCREQGRHDATRLVLRSRRDDRRIRFVHRRVDAAR
jgi:hypothetical protein